MSRIVRLSTIRAATPCPGLNHKETLDRILTHLDSVTGSAVCDNPDLILLSETCDMPYFPDAKSRHDFCKYRGASVDKLISDICRRNKVNICYGSFRYGVDGWYRNSAVFVDREGEIAGIYNKNHLVIEEHTESQIKYGKEPVLVNMDFGKVGAAICYDLQFDELREKYMEMKPELIVFPTMFGGGFLKQYWAFSNRCWFLSSYASAVAPCELINPLGQVVAESSFYFPHMTVDINLDYCIWHLDYNRERITKMKEKYGEKVKIDAPTGLGRAMITSYSDSVSALEMVKEFDIELIDDLFARNLSSRNSDIN